MRRLIAFPCAGETLAGTLDAATGTTGLLIVSGGNEIRIGAHRGMAELAQRLAGEGIPVLRYDRRGIGDSTGENRGFERSDEEIAAALAAFRRELPQVSRIVAFGNCDAATALALFEGGGVDALILSNPWVIEETDSLPPASAIRARYAERLRDPRAWLRLLRGGVDLRKLFQGLSKIFKSRNKDTSLTARLARALVAKRIPVTILLARRDNTAIAFAEAWAGSVFNPVRARVQLHQCDTASHSYARAEDKAWLLARIDTAIATV